ncbi:Ethylene-insensitive protein 2.1-like protein [Drosera capensis]
MEAGDSIPNNRQGLFDEIVPVVTPLLLLSIGYIEPGKWAACIDSGARFGGDITGFLLVFYLVSILYHYLAAHVTVVSGRNLAQICRDEYDSRTSILLGVQAELSMILLDLSMILGIAQGLNLIPGINLFTSVLLTALTAGLFPLFSTFLENPKNKFFVIWTTGLTFGFYVLGMMLSQPEFSVPPNSALFKLSGETAFALMSLLGASVMPHNFYLHSSIVQRCLGSSRESKSSPFYNSVFTTVTIFSGVSLVNFMLINSAANVFNSAGLVLLTFQDALSLMDEASRSSVTLFVFFLLMLLANQISSVSWEFGELGGYTILHEFFGVDLPGWVHRVMVRFFSVSAALCCLWYSGAEGMYQILIFTQVLMALLLPSSAIPLFRIASSRQIMGVDKMSPVVEFLALMTLLGFIVLEIILVVEMIFGDSDWVGNLRWNMVYNISAPYIFLLLSSCISLCSVLWVFVTPLNSATVKQDAQPWSWDIQNAMGESFIEGKRDDKIEPKYELEPTEELGPTFKTNFSVHSDKFALPKYDVHLPEHLDTDQEPRLTTIEENYTTEMFTASDITYQEPSTPTTEVAPVQNPVSDDSDDAQLLPGKNEQADPVKKAVPVEDDSTVSEKGDEAGDSWEREEPSKEESVVDESVVDEPVVSEGPGSFRSVSGKSDDSSSGPASLSRISGLGRAARKNMSFILDEFWGQLYDFHGQFTQEAKSRKLDLLLGVGALPGKDYATNFQSVRGSDSVMNSGLSGSLNQLNMQGTVETMYGAQRGSPAFWDRQMQSSDAIDAAEKRYSSLRLPVRSDSVDYQPATIHGYQLASYVGRMKERYGNGQLESVPQQPTALGATNYDDPYGLAARLKATCGYRSFQEPPPGFPNRAVSRNSTLKSEKPQYDLFSNDSFDPMVTQTETKKYHSLPEISGLSLPYRSLYTSDVTNSIWASPTTPKAIRVTGGRAEPASFSSLGSRTGAPLAFDDLSPSKPMRDVYMSGMNPGSVNDSLWSKPPFEQYGVANKTPGIRTEVAGDEFAFISQEPTSLEDVERKLLQSMRQCILKLLKLDGSDWLFRQNDGLDEELIDRVAARERFLCEIESREVKQGQPDINQVSSVPNCGEGCTWKVDLVVSFGVFCIHRILELSLMESRPELWGRYTYVLNRLQGVIEMGFFKPRSPTPPCFCLQLPTAYQQRSSPPISNGKPPPLTRSLRGKLTTAGMLLEIIKDIELAISSRKGRAGTAAGEVAFPKGKENLVSVLKRYRRRLSNKPVGGPYGAGAGIRKLQNSGAYTS